MSANWNLPVLSSLYTDVLNMLKDRDSDSLTLQITPTSSPPTGAFKFDRVNNYFAEFNGTSYIPKVLSIEGGGTGADSIAGVLDSLNLGTMSVQDSNNVTITGGSITGLSTLQTVNLAVTGTVVFPANSINEAMIANGALLARVADAETITGLWTHTGNIIINGNLSSNSAVWSFGTTEISGALTFTGNNRNIFRKGSGTSIEGTTNLNTLLIFNNTSADLDKKKWTIEAGFGAGTGVFSFAALDDAEANRRYAFYVFRAAGVPFGLGEFQFGSTIPSVVFPNGSITVPGIRFHNNSTHGIYSENLPATGENAVAITANSGEGRHLFSKWSYEQHSIFPSISFVETDGPTDEKRWQIYANGGDFVFRALNDAATVSGTIFTISRAAEAIDSIKVFTHIAMQGANAIYFFNTPNISISSQNGTGIFFYAGGVLNLVAEANSTTFYRPVYLNTWSGGGSTANPDLALKIMNNNYDGLVHFNGNILVFGVGFNGLNHTFNYGVSGAGGPSAGAGAGIRFDRGTVTSGSTGIIYIQTARYGYSVYNTAIFAYDATTFNCHVAPGTDSAAYLGVNAQRWIAVYANNGTIQTSDINDKEEILPLNRGLNFVNSITPIQYRWKPNENRRAVDPEEPDDNKTYFGFSGQELHEKLPFDNGLVHDGGRSVNYSNFIPFLVKSIQELSAKVEELENRVS